MERPALFALSAASALLLTGMAFAETKTAPKSVIFQIINPTKHTVDLDTDGGVKGDCKLIKDYHPGKNVTICTAEANGQLAVGGHLAIDRDAKNPSGSFGAFLKITSEPTEGRNFVLTPVGSSPITATLSTDKWSNDKEVVTITIADAPQK
jgi:hypothetical protein